MKRVVSLVVIGFIMTWSSSLIAQNQQVQAQRFESSDLTNNTIPVLEIYPNPVSEYLNIAQQQFDGSITQLEIIDLSGHTVYKIKETFTQLSIYVGNWQKGVYMVLFHQGNTEVKYKIVVK